MAARIPSRASVVVVGGGIVGCSVAYHLTRRGVRDVVLLERGTLTCGTTWHAAGLVGQLRATRNLTRLAQYSAELFEELEADTGEATGYVRTGSLSIATDPERLEELERGASMARCFGLEVESCAPDRVAQMWPQARTDDVLGGVYLPGDATTNPVDTTRALAAGAKKGGARIVENIEVVAIDQAGGAVRGVQTSEGFVAADTVVNCAGMWAHELGRRAGVNVPLHAAEHFYIVTEPLEGIVHPLPTWREPGACTYIKTEPGGRLLIGFFEKRAKPWGMGGIPADFVFGQLPEDWEHLEELLAAAMVRIPELEKTGIRTFFNGPESFTPDNRYLLGEAPELKRFFVAAGFNSIGIQSAGGAGRVLADWIVDGHAPMDLWDVDLRRMMPFQGDPDYLRERCVEAPGLLYAMHWPFRQYETARDRRTSPLHGRLVTARACFGELAGWERPNWYAPDGVEPRYEYSYGRQNWFSWSGEEHQAVREAVGLFDQTSFTKIEIEGPDAVAWLNRLCANEIDVSIGRIVYTPWLNERGGIEADLTVTRTASDAYLIVGGAGTRTRDLAWLHAHRSPEVRVEVRDVTGELAVLSLMGPESRAVLAKLTGTDLSNEAFPFAASREIEVAGICLRASRITYVGELGWELYVAWDRAGEVYDALVAAGQPHGLRLAGFHALESLRLEKGYRHWGDDITTDDNPLEAGLGFTAAMEKAGGFIGRDALRAAKQRPLLRRLAFFALEDSEPLLHRDEPVWRNGVPVGQISSGMFGHTVGASVGIGWVENTAGVTRDFITEAQYEIEIAGRRYPARVSLRPWYDPDGHRTRS